MIPLSIETGLVYMHPIRIPTDQDLQMYPHVFFTSPDIWDPSVLDHEILHLCLRTSTNTLMTHYFKIPSLMNMVIFTTGLSRIWISSVTSLLYLLGSPPPMPTYMTAILLKRIGNLSDPILVGSLNR